MTNNTYRIFIRSNKNPRTINTPMMGRCYYDVIEAEGKDEFVKKLNELVKAGEVINEVVRGYWCHYVRYWNYITK